MSITMMYSVFGDYFERFSDQLFANLHDVKCENVILASDRKVKVPDFVKLVVADFENHAQLSNAANDALETDWAIWMGFDDLLLPNIFDPIETESDVYGWPHYVGSTSGPVSAYSGGFETMLHLKHNPMEGGYAYRKEVLQQVPFRDFWLWDWAHFCELSHLGMTVSHSPEPRTIWMRDPAGVSSRQIEQSHQEIYAFQQELLTEGGSAVDA